MLHCAHCGHAEAEHGGVLRGGTECLTCSCSAFLRPDEALAVPMDNGRPVGWASYQAEVLLRAGPHATYRALANAREIAAVTGYLALGLCGEAREFHAAFLACDGIRMRRELGDVLWYLAVLEAASPFSLSWPVQALPGGMEPMAPVGLLVAVCDVAERFKRPMADRPLPPDTKAVLNVVAGVVAQLAAPMGGLGVVMAESMASVRRRFGEGSYSVERAENGPR